MASAASRHDEAGFTLLEVLIAFTVLTLTLTTVLQIFSSGLRSSVAGRSYEAALVHAENDLARLGTEIPLRPGIQRGMTADNHAWTRRLRQVGSVGNLVLYDVEVTVDTSDGARDVTLRTQKLERLR